MILLLILLAVAGLIYSDLNAKYGITWTGWRYGQKRESLLEHECQKHHFTGAVRVRSAGYKKWCLLPEDDWDETEFLCAQ